MEIDLLTKSKEYIREGKFEKAQIILRRTLKENPNQAKAIELSGDLSLKLGRTNEAVQRYDSASNKYMNNNQFAEAIICLEKVRRIDMTNEEIVTRLADLYRFYGMSNKGVRTIVDLCAWALNNKEDRVFISCLRKIVELQPKNLPLRLSFAKVLLSIDRKQDAIDVLRQLKSLAEEVHDETILEEVNALLPQPDGGEELDPKSRIELGNLLYEIGSKDEAIVEFEKAVTDLIATGDNEEATSVLNRILEIDPNNKNAAQKLGELQSGGIPTAAEALGKPEPDQEQKTIPGSPEEASSEPQVTEPPAEIPEAPSEAPVEETPVPESEEESEDNSGIQGMEMFDDLGKDIEGFIPSTDSEDTTAATETSGQAPPDEETSNEDETVQLEGQIADIEFLLKETEKIATPSFEISKEFDEFRKCISWQEEDAHKLLELGRMAYNGDMYDTALRFVEDIRDKKETWPDSLEIHGGSLIKLGRYNDAKKNLAAALIFEEIQENEKIELRYLLSSAYEGLGDFDNAMREIERIISIDANYKDVREIYALLGGKELPVEEPAVVEKAQIEETIPPQGAEMPPIKQPQPTPTPHVEPTEQIPIPQVEEYPQPISQPPEQPPLNEGYPTIIEEMPSEKQPPAQPKVPEKSTKVTEYEEPTGENITFL